MVDELTFRKSSILRPEECNKTQSVKENFTAFLARCKSETPLSPNYFKI